MTIYQSYCFVINVLLLLITNVLYTSVDWKRFCFFSNELSTYQTEMIIGEYNTYVLFSN